MNNLRELKCVDCGMTFPKPKSLTNHRRYGCNKNLIRISDYKAYRKAYNKKYYLKHREDLAIRAKKYHQIYDKTEQSRQLKIKNTKKQIKKFPDKYKARYELRNAVVAGKIKKQPCSICGAKKTEGHHNDYNKPLDVEWLCHLHHRQAEGRLVCTD